MIKRLTIFFSLVIMLMVSCFGMQYQAYAHRSLIDNKAMTFKVPPGQSLREILARLSSHADVKAFSPLWFEIFIRLKGQSHQIKAGEYELQEGVSGKQFTQKLVQGDVVQYAHSIIEGWTVDALLDSLKKHPAMKSTLSAKDRENLPSALGIELKSLEGWFFPETYYFPKGTSDKEFLQRAYQMMKENLESVWSARGPDKVLKSAYDVLILASIIERESSYAAEWPLISQVFHNRLKKRMRLQADPTVIYGMGKAYQGNLTKENLREKTPYNTYVIYGLPPTPIASPSFGSLLAAAKPMEGEYYYFVAKGDGSHYFSKTLEEHNKMVQKYLKSLK